MTSSDTGEEILGQFPDVRHNKQDGILILTSARLAWSRRDTVQLAYPYQEVKGQRISAESSSKVQLQLLFHSGGSDKFHFTGPNALLNRNSAKELLQQLLSKFSQQAVNPELEVKTSLLNSDPSLYQLYKDLVVGGLISADEFWANRLSGQKDASSANQESGLPSAFLADVQAVSDGCNAVKYNLTTDVIQAIFRTYPLVRAKHAEMVPESMSEEEFWGQFFQSQLFHRDAGSKKTGMFTDFLAKEHTNLLESVTLSKELFLTTETESLGEGYSLVSQTPRSTTPFTLLTRCNLHSSMVMRALMSDTPVDTVQDVEDSVPAGDPLHLRPSHPLPPSIQPGHTSLMAAAHELSTWTPRQETDIMATYSAVRHLIPGGSLMPSGEYIGRRGESLTHDQREQLFRHQAAIAELLRHFWACFPVLSPQLEEKAHKMSRCLQDYQEQKLPELAASLGEEQGITAVDHLRACIATALDKYTNWLSTRKRRL